MNSINQTLINKKNLKQNQTLFNNNLKIILKIT